VLDYVKSLVDAGYAYDLIQVRYTIGGDNGPVDANLPGFVKRWNEQFASPRLVIDIADAMFAEFERRHGATLPVMSGDMTPYWEDGAVSSAAEETLVRAATRRLRQAETLAALRGVALPPGDADEAWRNVLLWHEHTWGAADSINKPDRPDVVGQWEYKRRFATESDRLSRALLQAASPSPPASTTLDVVNTLSWHRSGLVFLSPVQSRAGDRVLAGETAVPSQRLRDGRLAVWIADAPPMSSVRLRVVPGAPQAPPRRVAAIGNSLDNGRVRVVIDGESAAITSLTWTGTAGHEFSSGGPGLSRYLYVDGRDPSAATASRSGRLDVEDAGPLVATVRVESAADGVRTLTHRYSLVAGSGIVLATIDFDKTAVRTKESAHVAFPFNVPGGTIRVDQGEALVTIPSDQLAGSCRDFVGVQSAIDVSNGTVGVSLVSLDAPLIELGAMTDERVNAGGTRTWREETAPGTTLYAYLLNNYWHTNYKADQPGPLSFRFALRPHAAFDPVALRRTSDEQDFPLLLVDAEAKAPGVTAPFTLVGDAVVVTSLRQIDGAVVARVHNPATTPASIVVRPRRGTVSVIGPAGTEPAPGGRVTLPPRSSRTLRLVSP
jgi:hypothetical protein